MVFTTTNLFKGIPCPGGDTCGLTSCIFAHELASKKYESNQAESNVLLHEGGEKQLMESLDLPPTKRRKIMNLSEKPSQRRLSTSNSMREEVSTSLQERERPMLSPAISKAAARPSGPGDEQTLTNANSPMATLFRQVSPPPTSKDGHSSSRQSKSISNHKEGNRGTSLTPEQRSGPEKLNPRLIPNDPAGHSKRSLYLRHLHAEMSRLNQKLIASSTGEAPYRELTEQEVILLAINEEERIAREQPKVYPNLIKNRIVLYKKMEPEAWAKIVQESLALHTDSQNGAAKSPRKIDTGLCPEHEVIILEHLVADQTPLSQFGYILKPPTTAQAAEAASAVEASKNYEQCDRCGARFQVFPGRDHSGALTSNGPCRHHPNKKAFPLRSKSDHYTGPKEPYYPCCNASVGSMGCTNLDNHVFKTNSAARLASTLSFIETPENSNPVPDHNGCRVMALTFDCEMGYTVLGLELIRLTAISWPLGETLVDVLVRPLGAIIDLNSRFSGVWPEHYVNAVPYEQWQPRRSNSALSNNTQAPNKAIPHDRLPLVSSPQQARALLCSFLTPDTPVLGHAIDNDLNAVRLCHPTIVDTVLLFPHPRGLPMRLGLKSLSAQHLSRSIQTSGARGHDSFEDADATGELVRVKVRDTWRLLQARGWTIKEGKLAHPTQTTVESGDIAKGGFPLNGKGSLAGQKRKQRSAGGNPGDSELAEDGTKLGIAGYLQRGMSN